MMEFPKGQVWECDVPEGHIASVITYLCRTQGPRLEAPVLWPTGYHFRWLGDCSGADYRAMFRRIGGPWLWFSRLLMTDDAIEAELSKVHTHLGILHHLGKVAGYVEMSRADGDTLYVSFLGLAPGYDGKGLGTPLMEIGIAKGWFEGCKAVRTHTCTLDHPAALSFYLRCGFEATGRAVEIAPDPRLEGVLPLDVRPQYPML